MNISNINESIIDKPLEQLSIKKVYIDHFQSEKNTILDYTKPLSRIRREQSPLKPLNIVQSASSTEKMKLEPIGIINGQTIVNNPYSAHKPKEPNREISKYLLSRLESKKRSSFPSLTNDITSSKNQNENATTYLKLLNTKGDLNQAASFKTNSSVSLLKFNLNKSQLNTHDSYTERTPEPFLIKGNNLVQNDLTIQVLNNEQKTLFESKVSQFRLKKLKNKSISSLTANQKTVVKSNDRSKNKQVKKVLSQQCKRENDLLEPGLCKFQGFYTTAVTSSSQLKIHQFNSKFIKSRPLSQDSNVLENNNSVLVSTNHRKSNIFRNLEFIRNEQHVSRLKHQMNNEPDWQLASSRGRETDELDRVFEAEALKKNRNCSTDMFKFFESDKTSSLLNRLKPVDVSETKLRRTIDDLICKDDNYNGSVNCNLYDDDYDENYDYIDDSD